MVFLEVMATGDIVDHYCRECKRLVWQESAFLEQECRVNAMNDSTATLLGNHPAARCELHSRPRKPFRSRWTARWNVSWASTASGGWNCSRASSRSSGSACRNKYWPLPKHRAICCRHCWPPHPPSRRTCGGRSSSPGTGCTGGCADAAGSAGLACARASGAHAHHVAGCGGRRNRAELRRAARRRGTDRGGAAGARIAARPVGGDHAAHQPRIFLLLYRRAAGKAACRCRSIRLHGLRR